jgi:hypothetical protein
MTDNHYDPSEIDRVDPELDGIAAALERYADATRGEPPAGLTAGILRAIDDEPAPRSGLAVLVAGWTWPARSLAAAVVLAGAVVTGLALGGLLGETQPDVGASPTPPASVGPSPTSSLSPSPSASPTPSPSPTATPSPSSAPATPSPVPTVRPASPAPTATDDDDAGDEAETPEPSESDDSSGSGSGSDD